MAKPTAKSTTTNPMNRCRRRCLLILHLLSGRTHCPIPLVETLGSLRMFPACRCSLVCRLALLPCLPTLQEGQTATTQPVVTQEMDPPNLLRLRYALETGIQRSFPAQRFLTPHEIFLRMNLPGSLSQAWDHRVGLLNLHEPYQGRGLWLQPHRAGNDHDPATAGRSASGGHGNTFAGPHCDDTSAQGNS